MLGARESVVVVRAPAGYGKSTLLAAWARQDPRAFAWLPPGGVVTDARDRVFVIDGGPAGARDLTVLVRRLGPGSRLVVASRTTPPLGRLRAQRDVLEIGPADLAMTRGEVARLLDEANAPVGAAPLDALQRTTEGWPAVLSLAAQSLGRSNDHAGAAQRFSASDPYVADYLAGDVLAAVPARIVAFLRRCSLLDVLDVDRCDDLLSGHDAAARLDEVSRSGLPVATVGHGDPVRLRLHPLVGQFLRDELRRREPASERLLRRRASRLYEARGDVEAAVAHAVAGRDVARAGDLLWRRAATYAWDGRSTELGRWLDALPPAAAERHASVALTVAMHAAPRLALGRVDRALAAAEATLDDAPARQARSLRAGACALRAFTTGDGGAGTLRAAAAEGRAAGEPVGALSCLLDGAGRMLAGDVAGAIDPLEAGVRRAFVVAPAIAALCEADLALVALCGGDPDEGLRRVERARARVAAHGLGDRATMGVIVAVAAFAGAVAGRFKQASADVQATTAMLAGRDAVPPWLQVQVSFALARALLRLSDVPGARAWLSDARRLTTRMPDAHGLAAWVGEAEVALATTARRAEQERVGVLTPAELRVLRHLPSHLSCREIAVVEQVSANTIKSQVHAVYQKLGVATRSAAVGRAVELGLIEAAPRTPASAQEAG
ncbi:LuxR C-terminal-related transcriptional regulator [Baekduia alba]|uniref:LuxR C-terminal-related transcriptional regulator n=1 Tax=Baekduia alba TaxID=2997333 RepID=UPI00233FF133|nr:LuxR C-terminal-related transcriptional regulator [Baekduia alba]